MPRTICARSVRRVSALVGLLVVFVAPYGAYAADRPAGKAQPRATAMAPKQGGRLTVAIPADFANLMPYTAGQSTADFVMELLFDKLYAPSPYVAEPEPWLAENAQPGSDSRTWVVRLRSGIVWHDGRPLTAEDVKFTYDYYRAGPVNRWTHHVSSTPRIEEITIADPLTLRFVCTDPCPWLDRVTLADLPILPRHIWEGVREPHKFTGALPIGTGPYRLVEHVPDQFYRLRANEQYFKGRAVVQDLVLVVVKDYSAALRIPWTVMLVGSAILLSALVGTAAGALAARRRGGKQDVGSLAGVLLLDSMPPFWVGMMLIGVFAVELGWLPSFGAIPPAARGGGLVFAAEVGRRMILPVATLTLAYVGSVFLIARSSMLMALGEDYVRTARAKGVSECRVVFRHTLRNALLPVYTNVTLSLGHLCGGATVVETVFSYPGLGRLIYEGVLARDYPLLQGVLLLVALGVMAANLLADLGYSLIDPRVHRPGALESREGW